MDLISTLPPFPVVPFAKDDNDPILTEVGVRVLPMRISPPLPILELEITPLVTVSEPVVSIEILPEFPEGAVELIPFVAVLAIPPFPAISSINPPLVLRTCPPKDMPLPAVNIILPVVNEPSVVVEGIWISPLVAVRVSVPARVVSEEPLIFMLLLATAVKFPSPRTLIAAFITILLSAINVREVLGVVPPLQERSLLTVIVPPKGAINVDAVEIVTLEKVSRLSNVEAEILATLALGTNIAPTRDPPKSIVDGEIVMSVGSSKKLPVTPLGANVFT
jgi:hypothetical protein